MPLIEEIDDLAPSSEAEMLATLRQLSNRLALPEDLLPAFMADEKPLEAIDIYRSHAVLTLHSMRDALAGNSAALTQASMDDQAQPLINVLRLYGDDPWTSEEIRAIIDDIVALLPSPSTLAIHLLTTHLRHTFSPSPHPSLHPSTSRALTRSSGGPDAMSDLHDASSQRFKLPENWGCYNLLAWAASHLSPAELERDIGVVLPPTLVLMDDWDPAWRGRGVGVLRAWVRNLDGGMMKRMGVDRLFIDSLLHTLSLHPSSPIEGVLSELLELIDRTQEGEGRMRRYEETMERGIADGWMYAKGGAEGVPVLVDIARMLRVMCEVLGAGIARWLKTIIPNLLQPLQFLPTRVVLPHYIANLRALLSVMQSLRGTGRITRWRGQIVDMLARLWVQLGERSVVGDDGQEREAKRLCRAVLDELAQEQPEIVQAESQSLVELSPPTFRDLVPVKA